MQIKQQIFDGNKNPQKISFVSMVLSNLYESNFQFKFFFLFICNDVKRNDDKYTLNISVMTTYELLVI